MSSVLLFFGIVFIIISIINYQQNRTILNDNDQFYLHVS